MLEMPFAFTPDGFRLAHHASILSFRRCLPALFQPRPDSVVSDLILDQQNFEPKRCEVWPQTQIPQVLGWVRRNYLCKIPRRHSGYLIDRLIGDLKLLNPGADPGYQVGVAPGHRYAAGLSIQVGTRHALSLHINPGRGTLPRIFDHADKSMQRVHQVDMPASAAIENAQFVCAGWGR
jgi:hypothetical protein